MGVDVAHSISLLLNEIFNRDHYNIPLLDGAKCCYCGKSIKIKKKNITVKKKHVETIDRSLRVDCDEANGNETKNVTFHKKCWELILQKKSKNV